MKRGLGEIERRLFAYMQMRGQVILRAGELAKAQMAAERGVSLAGTRGDAIFQWRFRLLRCEILLNNGRAEEVLAQAEDVAVDFAAGAEDDRRVLLTEDLRGQAHRRVNRSSAALKRRRVH